MMKKQRRNSKQENGLFAPRLPTKSTASRVRAYYEKVDELYSQMATHLWHYSIVDCTKDGCILYDDTATDQPANFSQWLDNEINPEHELTQAITLFLKTEMIQKVNKELLNTPQAKASKMLRLAEMFPDYQIRKSLEDPLDPKIDNTTIKSFEAPSYSESHPHTFCHIIDMTHILRHFRKDYGQLPVPILLSTHHRLAKNRYYMPPIF